MQMQMQTQMQMQMQMQNAGRGGGGLTQLRAYGARDMYLFARGLDAFPHNMRGSIMHWFVGRADGLATFDDMDSAGAGGAGGAIATDDASAFARLPSAPGVLSGDVRVPFSVRKERAAAVIQAAWRSRAVLTTVEF